MSGMPSCCSLIPPLSCIENGYYLSRDRKAFQVALADGWMDGQVGEQADDCQDEQVDDYQDEQVDDYQDEQADDYQDDQDDQGDQDELADDVTDEDRTDVQVAGLSLAVFLNRYNRY